MISLPPSVRIYLCAQPVDGRRGIDALSAMVRSTLALDPMSGHLFCFVAAHGRSARILFWDHNGFVLYAKRLERGRIVRLVPSPTRLRTFIEPPCFSRMP